jgi:DNA-binding SARP family transcriptional activator
MEKAGVPAYSLSSQPAPIRVQLLGDFGVFHRLTPVQVRRCGQKLLAFLGLSPHPVARSRVAGALWPESAAAQASANLRAALSRLPRPDGLSLTSSRHTDLALSEHVEVDVWLCDAQIRRLRNVEAVADPAGPGPELDPNPLLNGDVLPLWEDEWLLVERERHRQARLHALERLSVRLREAGRFEEALEAALSAVSGEPLRESAHRRVIEVHLAEGNPAEALRQFEIYRRVLREELGLSPSATIRQLLRSVLGRPDDTATA